MEGSPGKFIEYNELVDLLDKEAYGVQDLVDLDLFYSVHYARQAIESKKLKACKINQHNLTILRSQLLEYWAEHRKEDGIADMPVMIHINSKETSFIISLLQILNEKFKINIDHSDLFRAMINFFMQNTHKINELNIKQLT